MEIEEVDEVEGCNIKSGQEWTLLAQLGQLKAGKQWKEIVANSHVVPRRPSKIMG